MSHPQPLLPANAASLESQLAPTEQILRGVPSREQVLGRWAVDWDEIAIGGKLAAAGFQEQLDQTQTQTPAKPYISRLEKKRLGHRQNEVELIGLKHLEQSDKAEMFEMARDDEVIRLRQYLADLTEKQDGIVSSYFKTSAPQFLRQQVPFLRQQVPPAAPGIVGKWLAEEASDIQFQNFFQWHIDTIKNQQIDGRTQAEIAVERQDYKEAVKRGVKGGWLHKDAMQAIQEVDDIRVLVGDVFDTLVQENGGYHIVGSNYVVIAQAFGPTSEIRHQLIRNSMDWSLKHEWNHASLGRLPWRWLDEAVTEHIARFMKHGRPDLAWPGFRPEGASTGYLGERELLALLLTEGSKTVSLALATRAYSARGNNERDAINKFAEALDQSWGVPHVLSHVDRKLRDYELEAKDNGYTLRGAQEVAVYKLMSDLMHQPQVIFGNRVAKRVPA